MTAANVLQIGRHVRLHPGDDQPVEFQILDPATMATVTLRIGIAEAQELADQLYAAVDAADGHWQPPAAQDQMAG